MMKLYIQTENGRAINHPALEDNLIHALGKVPENWEPFERIERPSLKTYEVLESENPTYQKIDGVWKDVWFVRPMTQEEKIAKQQIAKDFWANRPQAANWSAWIFNEEKCMYEPPIPRPDPVEGKLVFWSGAENNWKEAPSYPQDGKEYQFDFFAWQWVEVSN